MIIGAGFLLASLVALTKSQQHMIDPRLSQRIQPTSGNYDSWSNPHQPESDNLKKPNPGTETVIENKNVNVIVNVDPKEVARELWVLVQARLDSRKPMDHREVEKNIDDLKKIITPLVNQPSRRSASQPTAFEIGYALDHITRRLILGDEMRHSSLDEEIDIRELVARMLFKLKLVNMHQPNNRLQLPSQALLGPPFNNNPNFYRRSMANGRVAKPDPSEFVKIILNLKKESILRGNVVFSDN